MARPGSVGVPPRGRRYRRRRAPATLAGHGGRLGRSGRQHRRGTRPVIGRAHAHRRLLLPVAVLFALLAAGTLGYQTRRGVGLVRRPLHDRHHDHDRRVPRGPPDGRLGPGLHDGAGPGRRLHSLLRRSGVHPRRGDGRNRNDPRETAHGDSPREAERPLRRLRLRPHGPLVAEELSSDGLRPGGPSRTTRRQPTSPTASPWSATPPRTRAPPRRHRARAGDRDRHRLRLPTTSSSR